MEMEFTFYFLSVWQWLAIAVFCVISVVPAVRILRRAGLSAWWAVFLVIPLVNLMALWVFAFTRWPALTAECSEYRLACQRIFFNMVQYIAKPTP